MPSTTTTSRSLARVARSTHTLEGEGFAVVRPFPTDTLPFFDPFLLLDQMGPSDYAPGQAKGAPDHPHRGFETVTYLIEGKMQHRDSAGHAGTLSPGDVQWMTAGAGVVHSEMPAEEIQRNGGRVFGFQLWVNLPKRDKMMPPRYQEVASGAIPVAVSVDGRVRVKVIAGESLGVRAVVETRTPIMYLHVTLAPGGHIVQHVPADFNVFAFAARGAVHVGPRETLLRESEMALFATDGDAIALALPEAATTSADVLVIGGQPLREPVARYGPFVMNTKEEVHQAFVDYHAGRMGQIPPDVRRS